MLFLGFSAGLPLLLVLGTLSFRLREAGIDRSTIGFLSWVGLVYGFKWVWAPLVDRLPLPLITHLLGRRRSWLMFAQCLVIVGLLGMGWFDPQLNLEPVVWCALLVAFGSATQDIALDAFRIESADTQHQAALACDLPNWLSIGHDLGGCWCVVGSGTRFYCACWTCCADRYIRKCLPTPRLANGLLGHGRVHGCWLTHGFLFCGTFGS
jgi:MFS family permease